MSDSDNSEAPRGPRRAPTTYDSIWDERNLLSLDGGGIRGYWTLLVLEFLMEAVGDEEREAAKAAGEENLEDLSSFRPQTRPENVTQCPLKRKNQNHYKELDAQRFLPCHYFDLICGSSTGCLIAIMLSRFRMTVKDCLSEYERMSHDIFGHPRWISQRNIGVVWWSKYNAKTMSNAFKEVMGRRGEKPDSILVRGPQGLSGIKTKAHTCGMFATTLRTRRPQSGGDQDTSNEGNGSSGSASVLHVLRSYDHEENFRPPEGSLDFINFGPAEPLQIWEVARAATAAPMYFKKFSIQDDNEAHRGEVCYSDGGFGYTNNPTAIGLYELVTLGTETEQPGKIGAVVSLGTARAENQEDGVGIFKYVRQAFNSATDPRIVANMVQNSHYDHYWRLNDPKGLAIEFDEWKPNRFSSKPGHKTLTLIRNGFLEWAHNRDNSELVRGCAKELVRRRRLRVQDRSRWERFATAAEFKCRHNDCRESKYNYRHRFEAHFKAEHSHLANSGQYETPTVTMWTYPRPPSNGL